MYDKTDIEKALKMLDSDSNKKEQNFAEKSASVQHDVLDVTSVLDLKKYSQGSIVELPGFAENQPFVARLKRPSMLALAKSGKIPNSLLTMANSLFKDGSNSVDPHDEKMMKDMFEVMECLCKAAFVSPTYEEIYESGVELTDNQMMAVFSYTQVGVQALESFR